MSGIIKRVGRLESVRRRPAPDVEPVPLETPGDVLAILAEQINAARADGGADPIERARTAGFLAGLALRVMEAGDLAKRLEAVESVLKLRRDQQRKRE